VDCHCPVHGKRHVAHGGRHSRWHRVHRRNRDGTGGKKKWALAPGVLLEPIHGQRNANFRLVGHDLASLRRQPRRIPTYRIHHHEGELAGPLLLLSEIPAKIRQSPGRSLDPRRVGCVSHQRINFNRVAENSRSWAAILRRTVAGRSGQPSRILQGVHCSLYGTGPTTGRQ
jgi:hypothetical protein